MLKDKTQEEENSFKDTETYENAAVESLMNEKCKNSLIIYNEKVAANHNDKTIDYHN